MKTHFNISFPESEEILALYYALQENSIPCEVVRDNIDSKLIRVRPLDLQINELVKSLHIAKIKGFIMGWTACYYREELPSDTPLQVSRVPQQKKPSLDEQG